MNSTVRHSDVPSKYSGCARKCELADVQIKNECG